jgi:hypothetical protein
MAKARRMRVKGIVAEKGNNKIFLDPDEDAIDAEGITRVVLYCGETAADRFRLGGRHEVTIGSDDGQES